MAVGPLVSAGRISCRYTVSVTDLLLANPADGIPLPLYEGTVSAVFHETPKFLTHGPESGSLAVPLPNTSSVQLMPRVGTHEALHRARRVVVY